MGQYKFYPGESNPERTHKRRFCRVHGITGKQYRKYTKLLRKSKGMARLYLKTVRRKEV